MLQRMPKFSQNYRYFLLTFHKSQLWSGNWIYRQTAHESSFPTIRLPNGNLKFSHMNRKHFTIGDPMAFPVVKMWNKIPEHLPFPYNDVDLHLIQQCLGSPHAPSQTAAPMVKPLSHTYAVKFPLVTMARPKFAPKSRPTGFSGPMPKPNFLPNPWTRPAYDAKRHTDPIRRFSTMHWTNRPTDRRNGLTDHPRKSLITIGRCAPRATRPNNSLIVRLFSQLTIRNCYTCNHAEQHIYSRTQRTRYNTTKHNIHGLAWAIGRLQASAKVDHNAVDTIN